MAREVEALQSWIEVIPHRQCPMRVQLTPTCTADPRLPARTSE
jgi:hypothetical protein